MLHFYVKGTKPFMPRIRSLNLCSRKETVYAKKIVHAKNPSMPEFMFKVDVQGIREKVACQLVVNKYNEKHVPVERQFIAKHANHLLH